METIKTSLLSIVLLSTLFSIQSLIGATTTNRNNIYNQELVYAIEDGLRSTHPADQEALKEILEGIKENRYSPNLVLHFSDVETPYKKISLLGCAATYNNLEIMIFLRERGACPALDPCLSALHLAAHYGNKEALALLLSWKLLDVNNLSCEGHTPLYHATQAESEECQQLLLQAGAISNSVHKYQNIWG